MVQQQDGFFPSSNGIFPVHYTIWRGTEHKPKAVLQIAHGMAEHIERYQTFAMFCAEQGILVVANDHIGHGRSLFTEMDFGYMAEQNGEEYMLEDMRFLQCKIQKDWPDLPYFLLGHSMGSFLAKLYAARYGSFLDGVILTGTVAFPAVLQLIAPLTGRFLRCFPARKPADRLFQMGLALLNLPFKPTKSRFDWLSSNWAAVEEQLADPFCGHAYTYAGMSDICRLVGKVSGMKWASELPVFLPFLVISGKEDPLCRKGKAVFSTSEALQQCHNKAEYLILSGDRHEVLREQNAEHVYQEIYVWLRRRLKNHAKMKRLIETTSGKKGRN